jgi:hypothetical protein
MKKLKLSAVALLAVSLSSFGQTSTGTVSSKSSSSFLKKLSIGYGLSYAGPSVAEIDSTTARDNNGEIDGSINAFNTLKLSYRFDSFSLWTQGRATYYFDPDPGADHFVGADQRTGISGIKLWDAAVSGSVGAFFESPTSLSSQNAVTTADGLEEGYLQGKTAFFLVNGYSITPANRLGMYSRVRFSHYDNNEVAAEKRYYDVYLEPSYTYTINDTFGLKVAYEYMLNQMNGHESIQDGKEANPLAMIGNDGVNDILVGAIINIGNTEINPWISYTPVDDYSADSTTVGFYMSTTLF